MTVAPKPKLGSILADARGRTLYLFEQDMGTRSACTGAYAQTWPAFAAAGDLAGGQGVTMAKLGTADGQVPNQVTYAGHLLDYFAGDQAPGDVNGASIPDWFAVGPDGNKVTKGTTDS